MKEKLRYNPCPMTDAAEDDSCEQQINAYGTYEVQKTADTDNFFPAIAQGSLKDEEFQKAIKKSHR